MARVVEGFTVFLATYAFIDEQYEPYLPLPSQVSSRSWSSFADPRRMEGSVGTGTTTVSRVCQGPLRGGHRSC